MATLFDPALSLNHSIHESYDDFLEQGIRHAVERLEPIVMDGHSFTLDPVVFVHPPGHLDTWLETGIEQSKYREIGQAEAYARDLDYRVMIRVNVMDHGKLFLESQLLCFMPLMIGSRHDPAPRVDEGTSEHRLHLTRAGGTFIVQGVNKMIVNAENQRPDSPHFIVHDGWVHPLSR